MSAENKHSVYLEGDVLNFIAKDGGERDGKAYEPSAQIQVLFHLPAAGKTNDVKYDIQDIRVPVTCRQSDFIGKRIRVPVKPYVKGQGGFAEVAFARIEGAVPEIVQEATFGRVAPMRSAPASKPEAKAS